MGNLQEVVPKTFVRGTHRALDPEQTLARVSRLMPIFGVTRVADVTGLDCIGVPVAMAYRPNARSVAVSPGKGLDLTAAKASALMEAVEGWHAERIIAPLLLASYNELRFERRVVDIARLPRRAAGELHEDTRLLWIEGRDLLAEQSSWVPFEVVHTNYTVPLPSGSGALVASSNGLASGNHLLEAITHALCEVIERDASTLWHAHDTPTRKATAIDPSSVDDPACISVMERLDHASVKFGIWETTSDVGVAAFRCVIVDKTPRSLRPNLPGVGAGCHPSRAIALLRSLTEAAQTRMTLISGARDDLGVAHYVRTADPVSHERALQSIDAAGPRRSFRDAPHFEGETFNADLSFLLERVRSVGVREVVAVDLTKEKLGLPVVRVVVPGLEGVHDAPGYRGGERYRQKRKEQGN